MYIYNVSERYLCATNKRLKCIYPTHPAVGCTAIPFGFLSPVTMSRLDLFLTLKATTVL